MRSMRREISRSAPFLALSKSGTIFSSSARSALVAASRLAKDASPSCRMRASMRGCQAGGGSSAKSPANKLPINSTLGWLMAAFYHGSAVAAQRVLEGDYSNLTAHEQPRAFRLGAERVSTNLRRHRDGARAYRKQAAGIGDLDGDRVGAFLAGDRGPGEI